MEKPVSRRDHFAALAMQGLLTTEYRVVSEEMLAKRSYKIADAMEAHANQTKSAQSSEKEMD